MNTSLTPSIPDYEHFTHTKHLYKHYKYYDIIWVCVGTFAFAKYCN